MADDRDLIIGEIRGAVAGIKDHLKSQDLNVDRRFNELVDKHERDKQEAIQARAEKEKREDIKHAENIRRFETIERKATETYGAATAAYNWTQEKGEPLIRRVDALEKVNELAAKKETAARNRALGATAVWGAIAAGIGGLATVVGVIGLDGVAKLLAKIAASMGAQ